MVDARTFRGCTGSDNSNSKLTEEEVREIRRRYDNGDISQRDLADCYGVSRTVVCDIVNFELWTDV